MPAEPGPPGIVCAGLAKRFDGPGVGLPAVAPLTLRFAAGETTALVGPSGCGKSTLLRLIAGLETPSEGAVRIGTETPAEVRARAGLAVGFQDPSLLPWRTVRGNVALALKLARRRADPVAIDRLLALVGLDGFGDTRPGALSGGMRQRAAIARCLVTRPELLLLDEPFGAVDELTRRQLAHDLPGLWEARGTTTLFVTHSVTEAVLIADRVIVLSPRPATVVADIPVTLERPRAEGVELTPAFADLAEAVSAALARGVAESGPKGLAAQ
ncbi:MAG: ABC transporter ATP-binding protein [Rhodosalinus sp.]